MTFLILGFIGLLVLFFLKPSAKMVPKACDTNPDDRKHKWVVRFDNNDRKGYLVCKVCGKIPGED